MKKFLLLAAYALGVLVVSAQMVESGNNFGNEISKGWNTVYLQYNNIGCSHDRINYDRLIGWAPKESLNGVTLGFNHAFNIVRSQPLYIETGVGLQMAFYSDRHVFNGIEDYGVSDPNVEEKVTGHLLSAKIPVNIIYRYRIPNTEFSIEPLVGLGCRLNIMGKVKVAHETWYDHEDVSRGGNPVEANIFDEKETGSIKKAAGHFQIGWHVGANVGYKQVYLGFQYGQDFNKCIDYQNLKLKTTTILLGYRF